MILYEVNTRVLLRRTGSFDDIPDCALDEWARLGFDWIWMLGVWQTGAAGLRAALASAVVRDDCARALDDLCDEDYCSSCFAVAAYRVASEYGGNAALARLRERLRRRGMRLMLDFVPNHTALDHPWAAGHPEYYVRGAEEDLAREPHNYVRLDGGIFAHGRDPYFPGWTDTLQLDYSNPRLREAMQAELVRIAKLCDGVRCDMAMLVLPDVFERTWGRRSGPFWPEAIAAVRRSAPEFVFMAEVYWGLEETLQQQGFNFTYDKALYDRLREGRARPVREHLSADAEYQRRSARFLENHDEPRAAAVFPPDMHRAAAVIAYLCPGLPFFHQGQLEGYKRRLPMQLSRAPVEPRDAGLRAFYEHLLGCVRDVRGGEWRQLECVPAWDGNWTWDCFIAFAWDRRWLVTVNYAANRSQCYVRLPFGGRYLLRDRMSEAVYDREGDRLYLDLPPWGFHVFEVL